VDQLRPAIILLVVLTLVTGVAYPLAVTGIAQVVFPQPFDDPKYFWGRLSATAPFAYNAGASSGSNLGPIHPAFHAAAKARIDALREADPGNTAPVPADLVTSSASGLDPHITPAAAFFQVRRVAKARGLGEARVRQLVEAHIEGRPLGVLGEPRVNVLRLNLALDGLTREAQ
jgi:potassium-transporting ATPase KdpC subunit